MGHSAIARFFGLRGLAVLFDFVFGQRFPNGRVRGFGALGLLRRKERAWIEFLVVAEAALKPDGEADLGGRALRQHFAELPQLEQRDRWIVREVLFSLSGERDEPSVVVREERKVGRGLRGQELLSRLDPPPMELEQCTREENRAEAETTARLREAGARFSSESASLAPQAQDHPRGFDDARAHGLRGDVAGP